MNPDKSEGVLVGKWLNYECEVEESIRDERCILSNLLMLQKEALTLLNWTLPSQKLLYRTKPYFAKPGN